MKTLSALVVIAVWLLAPPAAFAEPLGQDPLVRTQAEARGALAARRSQPSAARLPDDDRAASAASGTPEDLPNFHQVSPGIWRSGQPTQAGFAELKRLGIRTVLDLRLLSDEDDRLAAKAGLKVKHVPMDGILSPSFEQVDRALAVLGDPANRPILVHCRYGRDRTGVTVAAYRVMRESLPIAEAVREARSYGCCAPLFRDLADYLEAYRRRRP
jgi:protein tyrosine/serine phosphatase